jgi:EmrB/QacA subfamily drug resistance transporter
MTATKQKLDPALIRLAGVMLVGVLAVVFDTTIVNVAINTLGRDLNAGVTTVQWVTTGYLLALGAAVPVTGWLLDRFGGKRIWMIALTVFLVGSIGASLAGNATELIAWRVVQGLGGGLMLPVLTTLLVQAADGAILGSAVALISLPVVLGPILGPLIGGLIVEHLSWRWIFWVNVPFCVLGLLLAGFLMPALPGKRQARLDVTGLALVSPGIAAIVFALSQVSGSFLRPSVIVPLVAGAALLIAFTLRARRRGPKALIDVRLFRVSSFSAAGALLFLSGFTLYGGMLLVPLYFQQVRGTSAFLAGLLIGVQGLGVLATRTLAGKLTDAVGARWVTFAGLLVVAAATVPFALAGSHTNRWLLVGTLVIRGIGLGGVTIPVMAASYTGLAKDEIPHASIITRVAQQVGGSFGTAVLAVVLSRAAVGQPLAAAFDRAFWWSIAVTALALVLTRKLPVRPPASAPAPASAPLPASAPVPAPASAPAPASGSVSSSPGD